MKTIDAIEEDTYSYDSATKAHTETNPTLVYDNYPYNSDGADVKLRKDISNYDTKITTNKNGIYDVKANITASWPYYDADDLTKNTTIRQDITSLESDVTDLKTSYYTHASVTKTITVSKTKTNVKTYRDSSHYAVWKNTYTTFCPHLNKIYYYFGKQDITNVSGVPLNPVNVDNPYFKIETRTIATNYVM